MIIGPYINGSAVLLGGIVGALLSHRLPERLRTSMPLIFGAASMCMGIVLVVKVSHMPVMVLSVILGAMLGGTLLSGERHRQAGQQSPQSGGDFCEVRSG